MGLCRYWVSASRNGITKHSPDEEQATRIAVRPSRNFGLQSGQRLNYLRWVHTYKDEPYEYGGHWFGGLTSDQWVGGELGYQGYGIDCSGLVSCGARWAEYGWSPWRKNRVQIDAVTSAIAAEDAGPGDIMLTDDHVRTIYERSGGTINMISAEGTTTSKVVYVDNRLLANEMEAGYRPKRL